MPLYDGPFWTNSFGPNNPKRNAHCCKYFVQQTEAHASYSHPISLLKPNRQRLVIQILETYCKYLKSVSCWSCICLIVCVGYEYETVPTRKRFFLWRFSILTIGEPRPREWLVSEPDACVELYTRNIYSTVFPLWFPRAKLPTWVVWEFVKGRFH